MTEAASWAVNFRKAPATPAQPKAVAVPYFNQLLMDDGQGWRDCFSATCAMLAAWKGKVSNENQYNHIRQKHGDSTIAASQLAALAELGLKATYTTQGTKAKLVNMLHHGIPVGTGILHHGMSSSPTGGGHWMLIVGCDDSGVIALDPYGELAVATGQWAHTGGNYGNHVHYSWKNWLPRFEVAGGDGYMLYVA
ncbi:MAG: C39 family peptidase [Cyanobium sp. MAG_237]|nr:C39 family peptidase [Cyanobium sp. MAG_237]